MMSSIDPSLESFFSNEKCSWRRGFHWQTNKTCHIKIALVDGATESLLNTPRLFDLMFQAKQYKVNNEQWCDSTLRSETRYNFDKNRVSFWISFKRRIHVEIKIIEVTSYPFNKSFKRWTRFWSKLKNGVSISF